MEHTPETSLAQPGPRHPAGRRRWLLASWRGGVALALSALAAQAGAASAPGLFAAVAADNVPAVRALLAQGADPNSVDPRGNSALYMALQHHALGVARLLLAQRSIRIDQANPEGETALMIACLRGDDALARTLLARGARVDPPLGKPAWSALSYAATNGHDSLVKLLLAHGARVDQPAPNGTTPLMMAAYFGHTSTVRLLLAAGADARLRNAMGFAAIDLAMRRGHHDTADVLGRWLDRGRKPGHW